MISVVVYAQKPERPAALVADVLSRFGKTQLHASSSVVSSGKGELLYLVEAANRLERLKLSRGVLLFADRTAPHRLEISEGIIVLAGADNRRAARLMCGRSNPLVTCGTGLRDTVTLSSSSEGRAVLCAQRRLPTVFGSWLEPQEFAVRMNGCGVSSALLAGGTAAVCGCDLTSGELTADGAEPW